MDSNLDPNKSSVDELLKHVPENGLLPDSLYRLVTRSVPIICTDGTAYRISDVGPEVLAIRRNTGVYAGKLCLVGGRVKHGESIDAALRRHFLTDLGVEIDIEDGWDRPFVVVQGAPGAPKDFLPEPARHVVSLNYLVRLQSEDFTFGIGQGGQEVRDFEWLSSASFPDESEFGYGHDKTFRKVLAMLADR